MVFKTPVTVPRQTSISVPGTITNVPDCSAFFAGTCHEKIPEHKHQYRQCQHRKNDLHIVL